MLICRIERFLRKTGMPWTKFGRLTVHDPRFVEDLRNGGARTELLAPLPPDLAIFVHDTP